MASAIELTFVPSLSASLALAAAFLVCVEFIPQILTNYRNESASGWAPGSIVMWLSAREVLGVYTVYTVGHLTILLQSVIYGLAAITLLWQYLRYSSVPFTAKQANVTIAVVIVVVHGGAAGLYFTLSAVDGTDRQWLVTVVGVYPSVALASGFIPQLVSLIAYNTHSEVSIPTVCLDATAATLSIGALWVDQLDALVAWAFLVVLVSQGITLALVLYSRVYPQEVRPAVMYALDAGAGDRIPSMDKWEHWDDGWSSHSDADERHRRHTEAQRRLHELERDTQTLPGVHHRRFTSTRGSEVAPAWEASSAERPPSSLTAGSEVALLSEVQPSVRSRSPSQHHHGASSWGEDVFVDNDGDDDSLDGLDDFSPRASDEAESLALSALARLTVAEASSRGGASNWQDNTLEGISTVPGSTLSRR